MEQNSLQEKVNLLEERLSKLEKIEKRRQTLKWIKIIVKVVLYVAIIASIYFGYRYIKRNYLDPYDNFRNGLSSKIDGIKDYDYGSLINGLFGK